MSIEDELKNLTAAITALGKTVSAQVAASADGALKIVVPFEGLAPPSIIDSLADATVVNAGEQTIDDPYAGLTAKQIAGKKAAITRKANKEKKAQEEALAESAIPDATEISDTFIDMGLDDDDDFLNNTVEDSDDFLDADGADNFLDEALPQITVMDQKDPRAALRAHLANISKALAETSQQATLVKMMVSKFNTKSYMKITEDKFDEFLAYAIALLPAEKQSRIT